jgi:hypothetical protein
MKFTKGAIQMIKDIKYTKRISKVFPNIVKFGLFGMKIYHLATQVAGMSNGSFTIEIETKLLPPMHTQRDSK